MHDIPEDIFVTILFLVVRDADDSKARARTLCACSQVCRSWRFSALRCTRLWADIIDYEHHSKSWITELLTRSGTSPLDITRKGDGDEYCVQMRDDVLGLLLDQTETGRWRHVGLYTDKCWKDLVHRFLSRPAPILESLTLGSKSHSPQVLRGSLFGSSFPSLRSISLLDVDFQFDVLMSIPHSLEELSVSYRSFGLDKWLQFLQVNPRLSYLCLCNVIASGSSLTTSIPVRLDGLKLLCLESSAEGCKALMDNLSIPSRCGLIIRCHQIRPGVDERFVEEIVRRSIGSWTPDVANRALHARLTCKNSISLGNLNVDETRPFTSVFRDIRSGQLSSADPPLLIRVGTGDLPNNGQEIRVFVSLFRLFERTFPTTTLLKLWIEGYLPSTTQIFNSWMPGLRKLNNLKTLEIFDISYNFLFPLLRQTDPQNGAVLLPSLDTIQFLSSQSYGLDARDPEEIESFLLWRKEQGHPISSVDVSKSFRESVILSPCLRTAVPNHNRAQ